MTITNNIKKVLDKPVWQWTRFAPTTTTATSGLCSIDDGSSRYLYYLSTGFYRYDTWTDSWQTLATPPTAAVTGVSLKYSKYGGYRGNCLSATSTTIQIAGIKRDALTNQTIRIMSGTGAGQERTITATTENTIHVQGIVTTATALVITDSTKKWAINQYIGYQVRLVFGTGQSQVRKILYNDATNIYVSDTNYQQLDTWANAPFSATAPYAIPVSTAGSQTMYFIESLTATINTAWTVTPDSTSSFVFLTGGIFMVSASATAPWATLQFYDIATDTWLTKTAMGGQLAAALGTDFTIERTGEVGGAFATGTASAGASRSLTDSSKTWATDQFTNYQVRITGGTGLGQRRRIIGNTTTILYIDRPWDVTTDATSTYSIFGDTDMIYLMGNGMAQIFGYSVEFDTWISGPMSDAGTVCNISCKFAGQEPFGVSTGTRATTSVTACSITAGGTGYVIGDVLTLSTGGANAKVRVTGVTNGVITDIVLQAAGSGYSVTSGQATTGGTGSGCTINVTAVGTTGRITLATNHNLCQGDSVTFAGCSESLWNATYTLLATDSLTTFDVITTATATMAANASQSVTVIVDASKNWTVNEHVGKLVNLNIAGKSPTTQIRRITANTATTLTVATIVAGVNGTSRYTIQEPYAFGKDVQFRENGQEPIGWASSGSTTTLVDSTKSWIDNCWVGTKVRILSGTGLGNEVAITANTGTTLTYATQSFTPDTTTKYMIMDSFGQPTGVTNTTNAVVTNTAAKWIVNQWAGKRLHITGGTGIGQEITITSNTATALTCSGVFGTAPDTTSTYQILGAPARSTGIACSWIFGNSLNTSEKGRYILSPRGGGSNLFDRFNIVNSTWDFSYMVAPQSETLTTGSMYSYDGTDSLYFTKDATGRIYVLNVNTGVVQPSGTITYGMGAAIIGNRMEIVITDDGLKFLYIMRHTGQEMFRTLIFW